MNECWLPPHTFDVLEAMVDGIFFRQRRSLTGLAVSSSIALSHSLFKVDASDFMGSSD